MLLSEMSTKTSFEHSIYTKLLSTGVEVTHPLPKLLIKKLSFSHALRPHWFQIKLSMRIRKQGAKQMRIHADPDTDQALKITKS